MSNKAGQIIIGRKDKRKPLLIKPNGSYIRLPFGWHYLGFALYENNIDAVMTKGDIDITKVPAMDFLSLKKQLPEIYFVRL